MGLIAASILTLFLNKKEDNKILACFLIIYITLKVVVSYLSILTLEDYISLYILLTIVLCVVIYVYTERLYFKKMYVVGVILPQLYYISILYKPYLLLENIPLWWLFNADTIFMYSVFFILYENGSDFNFKGMSFRNFIINITILFILFLF